MTGARLRVLGAAVAACLLSAACSGPREDIDVGIREFPSEVILGAGDEPPASGPAPVPPVAVVLDGPAFDAALLAPLTTAPRPGPTRPGGGPGQAGPAAANDPCPAADPLAAPQIAAGNRSTEPPSAGSLDYRNKGTFDVTGPNARKGVFPPEGRRTVRAVRTSANGFGYEVAAELAGTTTVTRYQVIPTSEVPGEAGLYIAGVRTEAPGAPSSSFTPPLPLKLLEFPAFPGLTYRSAGTDPVTATTMSFTATVGTKVRVDACGSPIDAIRVDLTDGRVDGPGTNVEFTATYAIATQFGALSVQDTVEVSGREGIDTVNRKNTATVNRVPGR